MNISYLLSVLDLYLMKERNEKMIIAITNYEDYIRFDFSYSITNPDKTFIKLDKDIVNDYLKEIIGKIQKNLIVNDESYSDANNKKVYTIVFNNGRRLILNNFDKDKINNVRNMIFNINHDFDITSIATTYDSNLKSVSGSNNYRYSMGFTNYMTLFISSLLLLNVFIISLWFFKNFIS